MSKMRLTLFLVLVKNRAFAYDVSQQSANKQTRFFKVNVVPFETEHFALTHARVYG